jgi:transcriptional regulator with XRE-family HTH domain
MESRKFLKLIGSKIRAVRKTKKISQEKLAELSGVHPTYISDVENGKVNASIYNYYTLANALEIPLSELVSLPSGSINKEIEMSVAELLGTIRTLDKQKQVIFLSAAKGLFAGLEKVK